MRLGFYGGTFDPIHNGHIHAALTVHEYLDAPVHLILAARPSHRVPTQSNADHRWRMLNRACDPYPQLIPNDIEMRSQKPSYTYNTLAALRTAFPERTLCWVVGQDAFATLPSWYHWEQLLDLCNIVVLQRPGFKVSEPAAMQTLLADRFVTCFTDQGVGEIVRLNTPMRAISATQVRAKIAANEPTAELVCEDVDRYIKAHDLYQKEVAH